MKKVVKNIIYIIKYPLTIPHLLVYLLLSKNDKELVRSDINEMNKRLGINRGLAFFLIFYKPYRNLFYFRIGAISTMFSYILRPYPLFVINCETLGPNAFVLNHPYGTILNAKSIGSNFMCCHLTTLGNARHGRNDLVPILGNNVSLGANVTIVGNVKIGSNVLIGAGSVVVKDIPDNCVAAGNPARVIKSL